MKIFRSNPAMGKPRKIKCTGCGKRAFEAGFAVKPEAIEEGYGAGVEDSGLPEGPVMIIDGDDAHPLCEECVTALLRDEDAAAAKPHS
jgi:hypothetical protein